MATIYLHEENNEATVKLSGDYEVTIEELIATISPRQVRLVRLSDRNAPQSFLLSRNEIEELVASWQLFQQKQTEKFETQEKAEEDARIAEAESIAKAYGIFIIRNSEDGTWRLLLPDKKETKKVGTIGDLFKQMGVAAYHIEKQQKAQMVEEHTQVL